MIEIKDETIFSLTDAAKFLPHRRAGKKPHVATLYRWASHGLKGIRLETIQVGGTLCTSIEALQRFFERLAGPPSASAIATPAACNRRISRAEKKLREIGI